MLYFGVSENAAKYMFHRRRRGYPFKKEGDENYLKWSNQLQNAFITADKHCEVKWNKLKFKDDLEMLEELVGSIDLQPKTITIEKIRQQSDSNLTRKGRPSFISKIYDKELSTENESDNPDDGWTVVKSSRNKNDDKILLRKMGFLPQQKIVKKIEKK